MAGLILGSTSAYRRALLERLRVPFTVEAPQVDEAMAKREALDPLALAQELARQKARAVAARRPQAVVIGSDQVAVLDNEVLDKPGDPARAAEQLRRLRGREHRLITAVAIARGDELTEFVDVTRLAMRQLTDAEIARYLAADEPFDCAGSYKIEALGVALFERIDTRDHTAITGLPLLQLSAELRKLGVAVP